MREEKGDGQRGTLERLLTLHTVTVPGGSTTD